MLGILYVMRDKEMKTVFFLFCFFTGVNQGCLLEAALPEHTVDCSCASQEMPQLQITDQAKHVWRWALRGINSPHHPLPSPVFVCALTPATTFITGRENTVRCPLTNTCQFHEKELFFFLSSLAWKENKVFLSKRSGR